MEDIIFAGNRDIWAVAMRGSSVAQAADLAFKESEARLGREHPETVYAADTWAQLNRASPGRCSSFARIWRSSAAGSGSTTSSPCVRPANWSSS